MSRTPKTPEDWWSTAIVEMQPGTIRFRGYAIEELIGRVGFAEMVWLLTRGELPDRRQAELLEASLVAAVDRRLCEAFLADLRGEYARRQRDRNCVVLLDNIDAPGGREFLDLLMELQREYGVTVVMATHSAEAAERCADRVVLEDGRVIEPAGAAIL